VIVILENVDVQSINDRERWWIAHLRSIGCNLTNLTDGGDGIVGPMKPEVKQKISAARKAGHYVSWTKIHGHSEETKRKISRICRGRKQSKEERFGRKLAQTLRWSNPEERKKQSERIRLARARMKINDQA
jgi:hypothetical protein